MCSPLVKLDSEMDITPKLLWYPVMNGDKTCGDVLVTAELILRHKVLTEFSLIHFFQSSQLKHLLTTPGTVYLNQREALTLPCLFHRMAPTFPFFPRKGHQICTWSPRASGLWFSSLLLRYAACRFIGQIKWMWPPNWNLLYRHGTLLCLFLLSPTSFRICPQNRNIHGK